jgi:methyltransferase (TIGR00027 family)
MARKAAKTGPGPMVMVALEQHLPESARIINDELAQRILPLSMRAITWVKLRLMSVNNMVKWTEKKMPGMWSGFMCRKRYIDDKLAEAVGAQTEAVVNLGAGFDTRAYRLSTLSSVPVWEVDQPGNIDAKRIRIRKVLEEIPGHITLVPIDFDHEVLGDVLASYGYLGDVRTFFILEAVTQYLPEDSIRKTFDYLAKARAGSRLVFTYVRRDFIDGKALYGHKYLYENMVIKGKSWLFGMDPNEVADFLSVYGWRVLEHLGYDELAELYAKPTGRKLLSTPLERIVHAEKM